MPGNIQARVENSKALEMLLETSTGYRHSGALFHADSKRHTGLAMLKSTEYSY